MPFYSGQEARRLFVGDAPVDSAYAGNTRIYRDSPRDREWELVAPLPEELAEYPGFPYPEWVAHHEGATHDYTVPAYAEYVDVLLIGGGGGNWHNRNIFGGHILGMGGKAGEWAYATFAVSPGETLRATAGAGGLAGKPGEAGEPSSLARIVVGSPDVLLTAAGGAGGTANTTPREGQAAAPCPAPDHAGLPEGGREAPRSSTPRSDWPGGGGQGLDGGANSGASGGAWLRFRSY